MDFELNLTNGNNAKVIKYEETAHVRGIGLTNPHAGTRQKP